MSNDNHVTDEKRASALYMELVCLIDAIDHELKFLNTLKAPISIWERKYLSNLRSRLVADIETTLCIMYGLTDYSGAQAKLKSALSDEDGAEDD